MFPFNAIKSQPNFWCVSLCEQCHHINIFVCSFWFLINTFCSNCWHFFFLSFFWWCDSSCTCGTPLLLIAVIIIFSPDFNLVTYYNSSVNKNLSSHISKKLWTTLSQHTCWQYSLFCQHFSRFEHNWNTIIIHHQTSKDNFS